MKVYVATTHYIPHNDDEDVTTRVFTDLDKAKRWLKRQYNSVIKFWTDVHDNGYQYLEDDDYEYNIYQNNGEGFRVLNGRDDWFGGWIDEEKVY